MFTAFQRCLVPCKLARLLLNFCEKNATPNEPASLLPQLASSELACNTRLNRGRSKHYRRTHETQPGLRDAAQLLSGALFVGRVRQRTNKPAARQNATVGMVMQDSATNSRLQRAEVKAICSLVLFCGSVTERLSFVVKVLPRA